MILDNISRALKDQNWLAAAIEFVIVIAGVVIGFQINGWAENRQREARVQQYIVQIQSDLDSLLSRREGAGARLADQIADLAQVHRALDSASGITDLPERLCGRISLSHLVPNAADEVPAIDQIISSGQRELITDRALDEAIATFLQARRQARAAYQSTVRSPNLLPSSYPQLIKRWVEVRDGVDSADMSFRAECDLEAMRANNGFRNDLVNNTGRLSALEYFVFPSMEKAIGDLSAALAEIDER